MAAPGDRCALSVSWCRLVESAAKQLLVRDSSETISAANSSAGQLQLPGGLLRLCRERPIDQGVTDMSVRAARTACAMVTAAWLFSCTSEPPLAPPADRPAPQFSGGSTSADTIVVDRDTYVASADNTSRGSRDSLVMDGPGLNRSLVHVSQSALQAAVGTRTLSSARLELTIKGQNSAWPAAGATVDAHRLLKDWTEAGATWNCAIDANTGNTVANCSGVTAWSMTSGAGSVWATPQSSRVTVSRGQTGVVQWDVTADVRAFLAGTKQNFGWLLKRTAEGSSAPGRVSFRAREASAKPRLVLAFSAAPTLVSIVGEGTSGTPVSGATTYASGTIVPYSFTVQAGYEDFLVLLDGAPVPASGSVLMDSTHVLLASARPVLTLPAGTQGLLASAQAILTSGNPVQAFQTHLDQVVAFMRTGDPDQAGPALSTMYSMAFDPIRDSAAIDRVDNALANHLFFIAASDRPLPSPGAVDSFEPTHYLYINGIRTTNIESRTSMGHLTDLMRTLPTFGPRDTVWYFYNRTRRVQAATQPFTSASKAIDCAIEADERSLGLNRAYWMRFFVACGDRVSLVSADLTEAALQWINNRLNLPFIQQDGHALADTVKKRLQVGRHVILVPHSQGNLMLADAMNELKTTAAYDTTRDSVGVASVALASPTNSFPLLDRYHVAPISVRGDLVAALSGYGQLTSRNSNAADSAAAATLSTTSPLMALAVRAYDGLTALHDVDKSYFGQSVIKQAISDSLVRIYKELTVGSVVSSLSSLSLSPGESRNIKSSLTVKNRNGRKLNGRKLSFASGTPAVATVDTNGLIRAVGAGTANIVTRSWQAADTIAVTVADTSSWGPPITAQDSLTTGTWTGAWQGFASYPPETRDQGSGTYDLVLEAHEGDVRGSVTWTSPRGSFTSVISGGHTRVFPPIPGDPTWNYTVSVYFKGLDFPEECFSAPDHLLTIEFGWAEFPNSPRSGKGWSLLTCNLNVNVPSHSRRMLSMNRLTGPPSSLLTWGVP